MKFFIIENIYAYVEVLAFILIRGMANVLSIWSFSRSLPDFSLHTRFFQLPSTLVSVRYSLVRSPFGFPAWFPTKSSLFDSLHILPQILSENAISFTPFSFEQEPGLWVEFWEDVGAWQGPPI